MNKVLFLLLFFACAKAPDGWNHGPRPWFMKMHPDQRYGKDDDWTKGFNDGCISGTYDNGGIYKLYGPAIDGWKLTGRNPKDPSQPHPEIKSGKTYSRAWFDGYEECTYQWDWWVF